MKEDVKQYHVWLPFVLLYFVGWALGFWSFFGPVFTGITIVSLWVIYLILRVSTIKSTRNIVIFIIILFCFSTWHRLSTLNEENTQFKACVELGTEANDFNLITECQFLLFQYEKDYIP